MPLPQGNIISRQTVYLDENGNPTNPPNGGGLFGWGATNPTKLEEIIYDNGQIWHIINDGEPVYYKTDAQLSSQYKSQGQDSTTSQWVHIQDGDGNIWRLNEATGEKEIVIPASQSQGKKYREFGGNLYVEDPSSPNGLKLVMKGESTTNPLDSQYKQLQIQKAQQDLMSPYSLSLQQQEQAIDQIKQRIASGQMTVQDGNKLIQQINATAQASMQGTTPYQMQTDRQNLARGVLNDRMGNASSMATSLMNGLGGIYGKILSGHGAPTNMDPFAMARDYTYEMGGGQELSDYAKSILSGALQGQGAQPLPTGAGYLPPQQQMPSAVPQQPGPIQYNPGAGVEQYRAIVAKYFPPEAVDNVLRIMEMESSGNPGAHNPGTAEIPENSYGLMQINRQAHPQWANENLLDPETNIRLAAELYRASGYSPWYNAANKLGLLGGAS